MLNRNYSKSNCEQRVEMSLTYEVNVSICTQLSCWKPNISSQEGWKRVYVRKILPFTSLRRQACDPGSYPWDIVEAGCLWVPWESPPKWQRKRIRERSIELRTSSERVVKRGNFRNDGWLRWCPICLCSLEFTTSAALCKQLGSKTRVLCNFRPLFPPPPPFFMLGLQCPWENIF